MNHAQEYQEEDAKEKRFKYYSVQIADEQETLKESAV